MKLHLPVSLLSVALAALPSALATETVTPTLGDDLGNVMYVGDSITHGVNSASYRWQLHKLFVDNGISYTEEGVMTGNFQGSPYSGSAVYGGVRFENLHSSQASARAYEIAGRQDGSKYGRFGYSNIQNWLGQSTELNKSQGTYTGATFTGEQVPDTFFLLIGTNDLLSDISNNTLPAQLATIQANLLGTCTDGVWSGTGDMDAIHSSMTSANAEAKIILLTIPCWTTHANNNAAETHEAALAYNEALTSWAEGKQGVTLVEVNKGMVDVACDTPFFGCSSMFNNPGSDGLHPNAQGDLLMAGNIARALGYAGRTAGQERLAAENLAVSMLRNDSDFVLENVSVDSGTINLGAEGLSRISYSWAETDDLSAGFTLDLGAVSLGNGSEDGWETAQQLSITLGAEDFYGTLNINEAYIQWGDTILYSADMSQNTESLRVAWLAGNSAEGVGSGYYVWLGDMLIGESLAVSAESGNSGLAISYSGNGNALLTQLALGTGSYAPTSTGLACADNAFISAGPLLPATKGEPQGNMEWLSSGADTTATDLSVSGTFNARAASGAEEGVVSATITSGSTTLIYGNSGDYTGDVWVEITAEGAASSWYAAHGGSGTLTGNANLRLTDDAVGGSTVFGAVNAAGVTGNVYVELSAENARLSSFTSTNSGTSLVGSYATNIEGNVDLVVNSGSLQYGVVGGIFKGNNTIGGTASVYVNGGSIGGNVMGGGYEGTINGGTRVTITNGNVNGNVYGGGKGGIINAPQSRVRMALSSATMELASSVELTGGTITGDVYGGGDGGTINGNTGVTVDGSAVRLYDGSSWGNIDGGSASGTVNGDSIITLRNVQSTNDIYGFDKYAGTINGGSNVTGTKTLVLDNIGLATLNATLENFDLIMVTNGTQTTVSSFGGATTISVGAGCSLTMGAAAGVELIYLGEGATLNIGSLTAESVTIDITGLSSWSVGLTALSDGWQTDVSHIRLRDGDTFYSVALADVDTQAGAGNLVVGANLSVPEPATATLSLLGLAALARRRRRQ